MEEILGTNAFIGLSSYIQTLSVRLNSSGDLRINQSV